MRVLSNYQGRRKAHLNRWWVTLVRISDYVSSDMLLQLVVSVELSMCDVTNRSLLECSESADKLMISDNNIGLPLKSRFTFHTRHSTYGSDNPSPRIAWTRQTCRDASSRFLQRNARILCVRYPARQALIQVWQRMQLQ